jgi:hypothetical protein
VTAAHVLGVRPAFDSLGPLRKAKLSGEFERQVGGGLEAISEMKLARWARGLLDSHPDERLAALRQDGI